MARVRQRSWTIPGQRTKRKAWGFVTLEPGKHRRACRGNACRGCRQVRVFRAEWTKEDARAALDAHRLGLEPKALVPQIASVNRQNGPVNVLDNSRWK